MKIIITKLVCDRCKAEYTTTGYQTIGRLQFMILNNGSGSSRSDDEKDLCDKCTIQFLLFMRNVQAEAVNRD